MVQWEGIVEIRVNLIGSKVSRLIAHAKSPRLWKRRGPEAELRRRQYRQR
jgi:hypothetical protein